MMYHHCRPLEAVSFGLATQRCYAAEPVPARPDDEAHRFAYSAPGCECAWCAHSDQVTMFEPAYRWLASRVGFWPLFLAVGCEQSARMTGYDFQFRRVLAWSRDGNRRRAPGAFPNHVLFSWNEPPHETISYSDYDWWHCVLSATDPETNETDEQWLGPWVESRIFKRSWSQRRWHRLALARPHSVQAVVPAADLSTADLVRCRNKAARAQLIEMGFAPERVRVERWRVRG